MSEEQRPETGGTDDQAVLTARLGWLESAGDDDEARAIESALLAESDNGAHQGDPEEVS
jgi:hypothetical protein